MVYIRHHNCSTHSSYKTHFASIQKEISFRLDCFVLVLSIEPNGTAMGIKGLSQLIADAAPGSVKENEIKNYFGKFHVYCLLSLSKTTARFV